jgi:diacylglycerol kinase family enzyme
MGGADRTTASGRRQVAAIVSVVVLAAAVVSLTLFLAGNVGGLVVGLVGLAVTAAGAWWIVTETMPRRAVGVAGVVAGGVVLAVGIGIVVAGTERILVRLASTLVLLGIGMLAARAALVRDLHPRAVAASAGPAPRRPVLICNPWSGGGKVERFGLVALAEQQGVEVVMLDHGLDLESLARDAVARGADCLGMAGGDGSQALVASIAIEHDLPFVCVSAGTRNHFALDLGLDRDDPRESLLAFVDGVERRVDYATVGDRLFVNNVSLGIYATIVQDEDYRDAKADTARAKLPELLGRQAEPFDLQFTEPDGTEVDGAFLIQVSNNPYVIGASFDTAQRRRLDTGLLGVVAVTARTGADAASLMALSAVGQRRRSQNWHELTTEQFEVRSRSGTIAAGVDGEALVLDAPLVFRIHPGGLRLRLPADSLMAAERRRARDVDVRRLLAIAAGRGVDGREVPA